MPTDVSNGRLYAAIELPGEVLETQRASVEQRIAAASFAAHKSFSFGSPPRSPPISIFAYVMSRLARISLTPNIPRQSVA